MFILCACVYVENTAMASSIKMICSPVCAYVRVWKVYRINVARVGRSEKDKKLTLFTYMCMRVCMVRVFANGLGDLGSIPGRVIPKTLKMELDTTLLNTQHYKVRFKGKVEQSWEWSSALPYTLV